MIKVSHKELAEALREIEWRTGCTVSTLFRRQDGALLCDILQDQKHSQTVKVLEAGCVLAA